MEIRLKIGLILATFLVFLACCSDVESPKKFAYITCYHNGTILFEKSIKKHYTDVGADVYVIASNDKQYHILNADCIVTGLE